MKTILLHDDPGLLREIECSLIRRAALRVVLAGDSQHLQDKSRQLRPDLVVLSSQGVEGSVADLVSDLQRLPDRPECLVVVPAVSASDAATSPQQVTPALQGMVMTRADCLSEQVGRRLGVPTREAPRRTCRLAVHLSGDSVVRRGISRDISTTGLFVSLRQRLPQPGRVTLCLRGKRLRKPVRLSGAIVRRVLPESGRLRLSGLAIRFDESHTLQPERFTELVSAGGFVGLGP